MAVAQSRYARMHKDSHTKPLHDATAQMAVGARTHRPKRPQTQGCVIVLAQSFARMRNQKSKHDSTTPLHFRPLNKRGIIFWCGGRENPQLAGKAWMPYKMNAQSFARMRNQQSVHKRARMHDGGRTKSLCKDA